jgi:hypothetical protein
MRCSYSRSVSRATALLVLVTMLALAPAGTARGDISPTANPIYHGVLRVTPASGTIDRKTGNAVVSVKRWVMIINTAESDGIYPAQEPIIVALGADSFYLPAGAMRPSRNGKRFTYKAHLAKDARGIRSLTIRQQLDGSYAVGFKLVGVDLSRLLFEDPTCMATAVIVGSDDGFSGVAITSPTFTSKRLRLPEPCTAQAWPWT